MTFDTGHDGNEIWPDGNYDVWWDERTVDDVEYLEDEFSAYTEVSGDNLARLRKVEKMSYIDVVFDGPPSQAGRFVEVEGSTGASIRIGEWLDRGNGLWALRIPMTEQDEKK